MVTVLCVGCGDERSVQAVMDGDNFIQAVVMRVLYAGCGDDRNA